MERTPEQLALNIQRQTNRMLDRIVEQVMQGHENREGQCMTIPMRRRRKNIRRVPKTALIAIAAKRKMVRDQLQELILMAVEHNKKHQADYSQAIEVVNEFLVQRENNFFVEQSEAQCTPGQF